MLLKDKIIGAFKFANFHLATPIFIYTSGRAGTITLLKSISKNFRLNPYFPRYNVFYTHSLSKEFADIDVQYFRVRRRVLKAIKNNQKMKIIITLREPIAHNISSFIYFGFDLPRFGLDPKFKEIIGYVDEAIDMFFKRYDHKKQLEFFDEEVHRYLGFNIYSEVFNKDKGFSIYKKENMQFLVIDISFAEFQKVVGQFCEINNFKLVSENIQSDPFYKKFKERIVFPKYYLDEIYNSKFCKFFFPSEKIDEFYKSWNTN